MSPLHCSLVLHLIGVGMLFTTVFAGLLLHQQYKRAGDWASRLLYLKSLRTIGLLSPAGVALMLMSGIANMTLGPYSRPFFSDAWLGVKLLIFLVMVLVGVMTAVLGARRARVAAGLASEHPAGAGDPRLRSLDKGMLASYFIQAVGIITIIALSIVKPKF